MHVSVGRLRLRPDASRIGFIWHGTLVLPQTRWARGLVHASVRREDSRTFWSMSVWESAASMCEYRDSGPHRGAMEFSKTQALRVDFLHWQAEEVPTWERAMFRVREAHDARDA